MIIVHKNLVHHLHVIRIVQVARVTHFLGFVELTHHIIGHLLPRESAVAVGIYVGEHVHRFGSFLDFLHINFEDKRRIWRDLIMLGLDDRGKVLEVD